MKKKITNDFPLKRNRRKKSKTGNFSQKSHMIGEIWMSTFTMIYKKSTLEGVFEFFYPDPQLDENLEPTRNMSGQFFYIYIYIFKYIWVYSLIVIS